MDIYVKIIKISSIVLCILILLFVILIKFYSPVVIDFLSKVNPQLMIKMFPDYLAPIDTIYFNDIVVTDNEVSMTISNYDSSLVVKKVEFKEIKEVLYVYVYKGQIIENIELPEKVDYKINLTPINKIIHVGANEESKEIWTKYFAQ